MTEHEPRPRGAGVAARDFASSLRSLLEIAKAVRSGADVDSVARRDRARRRARRSASRPSCSTSTGPSGTTSASRPSTAATRFARRCSARSTTGAAGRRCSTTGSRARARTSSRTTPSTGRRTSATGSSPPGSRAIDGPEGWHPNDELFVPLEHSDGRIVGIMSFGDPRRRAPAGRRAARGRVRSRLARRARARGGAGTRSLTSRHQAGLEQLLHVSSQLPQTISTEAMLTLGLRGRLGGARVRQGPDPARRAMGAASCVRPRPPVDRRARSRRRQCSSSVGSRGCSSRSSTSPAATSSPATRRERRVGPSQVVYRSVHERARPACLEPPLARRPAARRERRRARRALGRRAALAPRSRAEHVLQALRIFANHAMEALAVATQLEETRFLADHDPLTRLLNRRALLRELAASRGPRRSGAARARLPRRRQLQGRSTTATATPPATACSSQLATLLVELVRSGDDAFRVGGDEFALLLRGAGEQEAREVVARIVTRGRSEHRSARPHAQRELRHRAERRRAASPRSSCGSPTRRCTRRSAPAPEIEVAA